ncbi:hypothetical protein BH18ACT13_BH18ACT13_02030 [soil metagenome]
MLVEYASLVAAMAVLTASLTGAFGQKLSVLPTSSGAAISTLNAAAGAQKVPKGGARTAYKTAPYSKPVLNYLYAVGWIGGKKSPLSCLFARTQPTETEQEALTEIKKSTRLVKLLRRVHVGQRLAASVVVKGIASACS